MSDDNFDAQILADKLSKLNSSQQSIQSLSSWCITHRKKARQIVEAWDKQFKSAQRDQRVSFLYLSNDILQNSRRKGSEFVNEFWKVLPMALKNVYGTGDERVKKAALRLVDIWEERKVFGSRGQNLKDEMLGKNPPPGPTPASNGKSSNPIKIMKRDAHSLRVKLAVGAIPEKILTSFQSVHDQDVSEEAAFTKFKSAILRAGEIERNVESMSTQGILQESHVVEDIQEQESVLRQCINQLESSEAARTILVSQLKDALQNQEPTLERVRTQLQVARGQLDQVVTLRGKLMSPPVLTNNQQLGATRAPESNLSLPQQTNLPSAPQTVMSISKTSEEEDKKAAAAAVVAKLAASTSSAQMLTSVLSSLVAEEAASMSSGSKSTGYSSGLSMFPPEKRLKLEKPMSAPDANSEAGNSSYFTSPQQQPVPVTSMQGMPQAGHMQLQFPPQAPPPPPPGPHSNSPTNQFVQPGNLMPYGYGSTSLPPPPPLPSHVTVGLARPAPPQMQQPSQTQAQQQNNNGGGGYYRPPGIGFYGQNHQPTPSPMQRQ